MSSRDMDMFGFIFAVTVAFILFVIMVHGLVYLWHLHVEGWVCG